MKNSIEIQKIGEQIQEECHEMVNEILKTNAVISYQDATNVYIFYKLASLEYDNKKIKAWYWWRLLDEELKIKLANYYYKNINWYCLIEDEVLSIYNHYILGKNC